MGYNTAIEDALNMGWKFASVLNGRAPQALLKSYEAERRPVALRSTSFARQFADLIAHIARHLPSSATDGRATPHGGERANISPLTPNPNSTFRGSPFRPLP